MLLQCFANSVGADSAMLLAREHDQKSGASVLATWTREGREPSVSWTSNSLIGRTFAGEGALVESPSNGDGGGHRAIAAAVSSHECVVGALYAGFEPPSRQTPDQLVWAAESYARLAGLCMSRDDVTVTAVLGSAGFDTLTGCLSHGGVIEVLNAEIQRSQRHGHRLSCGMIDLDGLKRVNDGRGHLEGNHVLTAVGAALRSAARRYDAVGRIGGDEFLLVLPETGGHGGQRLMERFLASMRSAIAESTTIPIGASVGIVEWDGEGSPADVIAATDRMVREAKARGGDRVQSQSSASGRLDGLAELTRQLVRPRLRAEAAPGQDD
jgi:diguanylate cyclase (GGDEF)-like protein